ncbi:MAG: 2-hydroxy-1,4-benzoquinone reductase [Burkholderia plantarii]|nr:MAG: 2-hydroxy-1,4-benzoquinone reductase [Burkholderia plantarii]
MFRLLSLSGSLRAASSNSVLLDAAAAIGADGLTISAYTGLGTLPHFNPDLEADLPPAVAALRETIGQADGLLISCPEYARGIPGAFKNALDWLVASETFPGMPVALFNASPRASDAQAALRLVLSTMSAELVESASITLPLLGAPRTVAGIVGDAAMRETIARALAAFRARLDAIAAIATTGPR